MTDLREAEHWQAGRRQTGPAAFVVAAPSSGCGKTMCALGLIAAFTQRGLRVASAKCGPDYIDPQFHLAAGAVRTRTLDAWAMRPDRIAALAGEAACDADLLAIEGAMGLFDGPAGAAGSTADIAAALGAPVLLVIDAAAQGQSAGATAAGFAAFRDDISVAGAILNRVASPRHAAMLADGLDRAGVAIVGQIPKTAGIETPSRHLGLVQASEIAAIDSLVRAAASICASGVDLDRVRALAQPLPSAPAARDRPPPGRRIAVASDAAFGFAYAHQREAWRRAGAEVTPFSPLADEPPRADADFVFLPGGYPELHAARLSGAKKFFKRLRTLAADRVPIYGECGGYMTLGTCLIDAEGASWPMAGLLPVATSFKDRGMTLGYRTLRALSATPSWFAETLRGHEFHYATTAEQGAAAPLFDAFDAASRYLGPIGLVRGSVCGSFAHIID